MRKILIVLLAACVVVVAGCHLPGVRGNGQIKTEERQVGAFANLDAGGTFEIEWQNGSPALRITTDENLLPYIENNVSDNTLRLRTRDHIWPTHGIKIVISSPTRSRRQDQGRRQVNRKAVKRANLCSGIQRSVRGHTCWQRRPTLGRHDRREPVSSRWTASQNCRNLHHRRWRRGGCSHRYAERSHHWCRQSDLLRQPGHDQKTDHWRRLNSP